MTRTTTFDTDAFIKRMRAGGFTEQQAKALAEEYAALHKTKRAIEAGIAGAWAGGSRPKVPSQGAAAAEGEKDLAD